MARTMTLEEANRIAQERIAELEKEFEQATEHLRLRNQYPEDFECYKELEQLQAQLERAHGLVKEELPKLEAFIAHVEPKVGEAAWSEAALAIANLKDCLE